MDDKYIIFTVASWEPRFWIGFTRLVSNRHPEAVCMYFYSEYSTISEQNRDNVRNLCQREGITFRQIELSFEDPIKSCKLLYDSVLSIDINNPGVMIDITAMPREVIWILLGLLDNGAHSIDWIYHRPERYNADWLSRDPRRPRLVPKMGGISRLGVPTKLIILSGFDVERTRQLMMFFEPEHTFLGLQIGHQFGNQAMNVAKHQKEFGHDSATTLFELDAYSSDQGFEVIQAVAEESLRTSNVIMTSLGPKPSAIALYRLHITHPHVSLVYAPSKEFNPEYSYGIGETIGGRLR